MNTNLNNILKIFVHWFKKKPKITASKNPLSVGLPRLKKDEFGDELCNACLMCQLSCPMQAIKITPKAASKKLQTKKPLQRRIADEFCIDVMLCNSCKICQEICPVGAIVITDNLPELISTKNQQILDKKQLFLQ